ncbi:MAG TPA: response regulator transcription factor [Tepidisphaeraceae bacterium]|jgi:DNA-binding NarL/FixJ family response regulator
MAKPRVLIADDHRIVAAGLEQLLASECDVVSVVSDGYAVLDDVRRLHPDVVVQDLSMPPLNGIDLIREIRQIDPSIKVVVVTMWEDPDRAAQAFRAGASAYVLKHCAASELLDAVQCAMVQQSYVTPLIAGGMIDSLSKPSREQDNEKQLTTRQRQVLTLLAEGKSMKEVAAILNLTARTVAFHKYRMMQLLNIKSSADLIRFAIVNGIA